ncbi:MAG: CPXCG motif-containing cysteine-rich protein [Planctomycetaceae bacterium]|nr:CPXCG motif-containing cysteine-rich protein [Planctomycetaceae bacterium]
MGCGTQLAERLSLLEMNQRTSNVQHEACYICDSCGEEIIVPLDLSAGNHQEYVEDCPVCCRPNVIQVTVDEDGETRIWSRGE